MNQRIDGEWGKGKGCEDLAVLVEGGRRLHDQAVFEAFARLLHPLKRLAGGRAGRLAAEEWELRTR